MDNMVSSALITMLGTLFGWLLAHIKIGNVKVLLNNINEKKNYVDSGIITEMGEGEFQSMEIQFRIIVNNNSDETCTLRNFEVDFMDARKKVIHTEMLYDVDSRRYESYGVVGKEIKGVTIPNRTSIDINDMNLLNNGIEFS